MTPYMAPEQGRDLFDGKDFEKLRGIYNQMMPYEQPALLKFEQLNAMEQGVATGIGGGHLLDVGCANARFLLYLAVHDRIERGTGVDISDEMIKNARAGSNAHALMNLDFIRGEFENLQLSDRYDWISMNDILEHFYSPVRVLSKVLGLLKDGGSFIGMVPYENDCDCAVHLHHFSAGSLVQLLSQFFNRIELTIFQWQNTVLGKIERKIAWRASDAKKDFDVDSGLQ